MDENEARASQQIVPADSPSPTVSQPRQPTNLQGLLRLAVEANRNENVSDNTPLQPLDEDRRTFLENAINSLSVDITKNLQIAIDLLSNEKRISSIVIGEEIPEDVENAFDCLESHVSIIEVANGFHKIGGFSIFPVCLSCENSSVRAATCSLLAELCQHNPFCQSKVLEYGYLESLVNMLAYEQDTELLSKVLYAISCIIRHHEPCSKAFLKLNDAYKGLKNVLEKNKPQLIAKASFLISWLYPFDKSMAEELIASGVLQSLVNALPTKHQLHSEQVLAALCVVLSDCDKNVLQELSNKQYNLKEIISNYLLSDELKSEHTDYTEEKRFCEIILQKLDSCELQQQKTETDIDR